MEAVAQISEVDQHELTEHEEMMERLWRDEHQKRMDVVRRRLSTSTHNSKTEPVA